MNTIQITISEGVNYAILTIPTEKKIEDAFIERMTGLGFAFSNTSGVFEFSWVIDPPDNRDEWGLPTYHKLRGVRQALVEFQIPF